MATRTAGIDAAVQSQIGIKRRRSSKTNSKKEKPKKRQRQLKPHTAKDIELIQQLLANVLVYNSAVENHFLYCGLTQKASHYFQFPIVVAEPPNKGELPGEHYFLGCDNISVIEYVLRSVYYKMYGGDPSLNEHKEWDLYRFNTQYYGAKAFATKVTTAVLQDLNAKTRPYGGSELPHYPNIAESSCYKTVLPFLVPLEKYFAIQGRTPENIAFGPLKVLPFSDLQKINSAIKKKKEDLLLEGNVSKAVRDVPSDDDDEDSTVSEEELSED